MPQSLESPVVRRLKTWHGEDWHTPKGRIIRDIVYAVDTGLVTTVSFIAGISASLVTRERIVLAGLIQITSGALAIFFGSYISTKAQRNFFENQIERERREIEETPQKEIMEVREIFNDMGFSEDEQEAAVRRVTSDKDRWLKFMVQEEIGITSELIDNPYEIGFISSLSFILGALPALAPFFIFNNAAKALFFSAVFVLFFLFILGIAKSGVTKIHWFLSGIETLAIGAISCAAGFFLGNIAARHFH
jgi:VIT1/CCC1 family predicted Fe2+/Mn2+ transporter